LVTTASFAGVVSGAGARARAGLIAAVGFHTFAEHRDKLLSLSVCVLKAHKLTELISVAVLEATDEIFTPGVTQAVLELAWAIL